MSAFLASWVPPEELSNPNTIWDWFKCEIRNFVRIFTKNAYSEEKQLITSITKELNQLYEAVDKENSDDKTMEIESLRRELRELEEARARKIIFRSRANWSLYGERPSSYFLNLEKRKNAERNLNALMGSDGTLTTNIHDILEEGRTFYEHLYHEDEESLLPIHLVREQIRELTGLPYQDSTMKPWRLPYLRTN